MSISRQLASQSVVIFALRIFGAGLIFVAQAAIARVWGAEALGSYLLATAAASLMAVVLPLGFQTVGNYFAAEYSARGEGLHLRHFLRQGYGHIALTAVVILPFGWPVTYLMGPAGEHLRELWTPITLIGVGWAVLFLNTTTLLGLKRPMGGYIADMIGRPVLMLAAFAVIAVIAGGPDLAGLLWLLAGLQIVLALGHFLYVAFAVKQVGVDKPLRAGERRRWWRFAAPWVLITLASDYFFDINLILLAGLLDHAELAVFGVSTRIFALASFGVVAVYALTLPNMFEAERDADRTAFGSRVGEANLVATGLALALFFGVLVLGRYVLMLFGPEFADGALPVAILCLGLVVRAAFGPASLVLSMHGRPWASLPSVALGLVALVAGNLALVPSYGLMGAAISAFIAVSLWSIALWATALHRAKIDVSIFGRWRREVAA